MQLTGNSICLEGGKTMLIPSINHNISILTWIYVCVHYSVSFIVNHNASTSIFISVYLCQPLSMPDSCPPLARSRNTHLRLQWCDNVPSNPGLVLLKFFVSCHNPLHNLFRRFSGGMTLNVLSNGFQCACRDGNVYHIIAFSKSFTKYFPRFSITSKPSSSSRRFCRVGYSGNLLLSSPLALTTRQKGVLSVERW